MSCVSLSGIRGTPVSTGRATNSACFQRGSISATRAQAARSAMILAGRAEPSAISILFTFGAREPAGSLRPQGRGARRGYNRRGGKGKRGSWEAAWEKYFLTGVACPDILSKLRTNVRPHRMRKINTHDFKVATRTTSRDINRRIALNLIREHQPISRADLARRMNVTRGVVSVLVQELIVQGLIYEGATGEVTRGRKPTFLHIRTQDRLAVAVDVRFSKTYLMLSDFSGRQVALEVYDTVFELPQFVRDLAARVKRMLKTQGAAGTCEGIGVVVPGMVDHRTGRVLNAPTLGWRDVDIRDRLAAATGLPVQIENSGRACSLAHLWLERGPSSHTQSFVYVSVWDGGGGGVVVHA